MIELVATSACVMAVFYYLSWRKAQSDLDALFDAVQRLARNEARITIHADGNIEIKDITP